ncbi:MAG: hypothetical protein ABIQ31_05785 [Ferruginibacter sp.]
MKTIFVLLLNIISLTVFSQRQKKPTSLTVNRIKGIDSLELGGIWYKDLSGSGSGVNVPGGPITTIPVVGTNPGVNIPSAAWIAAAFYGSQPPTATITGGSNLELTSAATLSQTLNYTASRQSATATLASIVVAGTTKTFTQPSQPGTVSGTQAVTVTTNTTTTYSNVVTTTDGKTATAATTYSFSPKRYWMYSTGSPPSSADIVAAAGGSSELTATKIKSVQFAVVVTGTNKYVSYAYPSSYGALSSIIISGLESIGAFDLTTVSVTNASGFTQNYYVYTTQNVFNNTTITFNSVQ